MEATTANQVRQDTTFEETESSGLSGTQVKVLEALRKMNGSRYVDIGAIKQETGCLGGHIGRALTGLADRDMIVRRQDPISKTTFYSVKASHQNSIRVVPEEEEDDEDDDVFDVVDGAGVSYMADKYKALLMEAKESGWTIEALRASKSFQGVGRITLTYGPDSVKVAS